MGEKQWLVVSSQSLAVSNKFKVGENGHAWENLFRCRSAGNRSLEFQSKAIPG
jgi:hypothetical protein